MVAAQSPGGHGDLPDDDFLGGSRGLVLGFDRIEQVFKIGFAFTGDDQGAGSESMLEAVETDGGASFGRARARAFLRVDAVGCDLLVSCHDVPLLAPSFGPALLWYKARGGRTG